MRGRQTAHRQTGSHDLEATAPPLTTAREMGKGNKPFRSCLQPLGQLWKTALPGVPHQGDGPQVSDVRKGGGAFLNQGLSYQEAIQSGSQEPLTSPGATSSHCCGPTR